MLFNSPIFLFLFLPLTLAGFFLLARLFGRNAALGFLLLACLLFYAYSSPFNFAVFLVSVIANFLLGYAIAQFRQSSRVWLIGGIILNLGLIGYFKYAGFLVSGLNDIFSASFVVPHIVLPVGISFYTFEQISYLVETRQSGRAEPSLMVEDLRRGIRHGFCHGPFRAGRERREPHPARRRRPAGLRQQPR